LRIKIFKIKKGDFRLMVLERLDFLNRFNNFYLVMVNSAKENTINEREFYMILRAKIKCLNQERRERLSNKTIVSGAKKGSDLKY